MLRLLFFFFFLLKIEFELHHLVWHRGSSEVVRTFTVYQLPEREAGFLEGVSSQAASR